LHVPHLIDSEIANGLRRVVSAGEIEPDAGAAALDAWRRLGMVRYPIHGMLDRVWELRDNLSAYEASYVALAEQLGCALLTADRPLGGASGIHCPITVVPR
jgi:predicted nucleic acid-binding protein